MDFESKDGFICKNATVEFLKILNESLKNEKGNFEINGVVKRNGELYFSLLKAGEMFGVEENTVISAIETACGECEIESDECLIYIDKMEYYRLDAVIFASYHIHSVKATELRRFATRLFCSYIKNGYAFDRERIKNGCGFEKDYFEKLKGQIKAIKNSQRRFYQKITDIFALSIDYDAESILVKSFFASVTNRMYTSLAVCKSEEIAVKRADYKRKNNKLSGWFEDTQKDEEGDYFVIREDESLAKAVNLFSDVAISMADKCKPMTMEAYIKLFDELLRKSDREIREGVTPSLPEEKYEAPEFKYFDKNYKSDFDRFSEKTQKIEE